MGPLVRPVRAAVVAGCAIAAAVAIGVLALGAPAPVVRLLGAPREVTVPKGASPLAMRETVDTKLAERVGAGEGAVLDVDEWTEEATGIRHAVRYLRAPTREVLERAIAARGIAPVPGSHVVFEKLEPVEQRGAVAWRTYEVADAVALDGAAVASAQPASDPYTLRPMVLLDLTPEGAERFCAVTRRMAGRKLVVMTGERVVSAPIITGPICGGHIQVAMGGWDPIRQQAEALALAQAFDRDAPGAAPALHGGLALLAVALLALGGGLAGALLTYLGVRALRPRWQLRRGFEGGRFPWGRLVVTLAAPVIWIVGRNVTLPGVNDIELAWIARRAHASVDGSLASVFSLGVTPVLTAYGLIELVALIVRPLRWRRHDARGRGALDRAAMILAVVVALVQGWFVASYLEALARGGAEVVTSPGLGFRAITALTLATGALVLSAVAGALRARGLGNGYGTLLLAAVAVTVVDALLDQGSAASACAWLACAAAIVGGTAVVLRWRVADTDAADDAAPAYRLPTSGLAPLGDGLAVISLFGALIVLAGGSGLAAALAWMHAAGGKPAVLVPVVICSTLLWSWLFARPRLLSPAPATATWWRATAISGLAVGAVGAVGLLAARANPGLASAATPIALVLGTAAALDIIDDARAYRIDLAPVAVLHQIQRASAIQQALFRAGIPSHVHAGNLRAIVAFFGPWAPAVVLVPAARADEGRAIAAAVYPTTR